MMAHEQGVERRRDPDEIEVPYRSPFEGEGTPLIRVDEAAVERAARAIMDEFTFGANRDLAFAMARAALSAAARTGEADDDYLKADRDSWRRVAERLEQEKQDAAEQHRGAVEEAERLREAIRRYLRVEYPHGTNHPADVNADVLRRAADGGR